MMEEEMITQSTVLALEIPWTEKPGGLQSMESQRSQTRLSDWARIQKGEISWWQNRTKTANSFGRRIGAMYVEGTVFFCG